MDFFIQTVLYKFWGQISWLFANSFVLGNERPIYVHQRVSHIISTLPTIFTINIVVGTKLWITLAHETK